MQPKALKPNFTLSHFWELDSKKSPKSSAAPLNHCISTPQNSLGSAPTLSFSSALWRESGQ